MSSRISRYLATLGNTNEREGKESQNRPCLSSQWSLLSAQLTLGRCSGQFLANFYHFSLFLRTAWDRKGGICVLGVWHTCCVTPAAAVTCMPRWHQLVLPPVRGLVLWAAWDSWGCPCSLQGGWSYMAFTGPLWPKLFCYPMEHTLHCSTSVHVADFPLCTDSTFYTKTIKWVFPVRKMALFCNWVTFVWSLLTALPRSSDILSKKAWKHLTAITFQRVCIYSVCWHFLMPRNSFFMMQAQSSSPLPMQLLWLSAQIKWVCMQMASEQRLGAAAWILICCEESHLQTQIKMCLCINIWPITKLPLQEFFWLVSVKNSWLGPL